MSDKRTIGKIVSTRKVEGDSICYSYSLDPEGVEFVRISLRFFMEAGDDQVSHVSGNRFRLGIYDFEPESYDQLGSFFVCRVMRD